MLSKLFVSDLWFSAEFMHLCIFNHWLTWTWTVCICILHLSVRTFLVLIGKDDSLTVSLYPLSAADGIFQEFLFFGSTRCVVQPLGCLAKYWGHLSVCSASLCLHNVSDIFGSGSKVVWGMFGNFCVTWSEKTFQSSFSILLVARLYHPFGCYWLVALWWEYLGPIAHVWLRGSKMFGGTALLL